MNIEDNYYKLQGLRVAQAAVTEHWPYKEEKTPESQHFFVKK